MLERVAISLLLIAVVLGVLTLVVERTKVPAPTYPLVSTPISVYQDDTHDFIKNTTKSGALVLPADLAHILPLPGTFAGLAEIEGALIAIKLNEGKDSTNSVLKELSEPPKVSPTDIVVKKTGKSAIVAGTQQFQLVLESAESIPIIVVVNKVNLLTTFVLDWESALKAGRTVWLPEGLITIPVIDSNTGKVSSLIEYDFGKAATVTWDVASNGPKWVGFTVRVKPA